MTTQGIPDDLRPAEDLPLDAVGALEMLAQRLGMLEVEVAHIRSGLLRLRDGMKEREA